MTDAGIRPINRDWRGKDKATDVLSFPQLEIFELKALGSLARKKPRLLPEWTMGDVIISLETARRQALEKNHPYRKELELLLVHGILHLLGFDHEKGEREALRMRRMERLLLTR